jgi:hypothetical protein
MTKRDDFDTTFCLHCFQLLKYETLNKRVETSMPDKTPDVRPATTMFPKKKDAQKN